MRLLIGANDKHTSHTRSSSSSSSGREEAALQPR